MLLFHRRLRLNFKKYILKVLKKTYILYKNNTTTKMTENFVCKICEYTTPTKWCLVSHLQKKRPCGVSTEFSRDTLIQELTKKTYNDVTFDCEHCQRKFNNQSNRSKHLKICKKRPQATENQPPTEPQDNATITISVTEFQNLKNDLQDLKKVVKALLQDKKSSSTVMGNQYNTVNTVNTFNVQLNSFGHESIDHLTTDFLQNCIMNPTKGLSTLIENIHYNKDIPENQNIRCLSLKQNIFEKYVDSEWRTCDASNTLDELIKKGYRILNAHYAENIMNNPEICENEMRMQALERFRFLGDITCNDYYAVKRDLRLLIKDKTAYLIQSPENANEDKDKNEDDGEYESEEA